MKLEAFHQLSSQISGFIFQFREFDSAGVSPEALLSYNDWVGSEEVRLYTCTQNNRLFFPQIRPIMYHMKRTAGTLVLQSLLPLTYLATLSYCTVILDNHYSSFTAFWDTYPVIYNLLALSILLPTLSLSLLWYWSLNNWSNHPMVRQLRLYARDGNWRQVAADIGTEFRRIDKICLRSSSLTRLVVTDHWVLLIGSWPWTLRLSHQSDISLHLINSEQHRYIILPCDWSIPVIISSHWSQNLH